MPQLPHAPTYRLAHTLIALLLAALVAGCASGARPITGSPKLNITKRVDWRVESPAVGGRSMHQYALVPGNGDTTARPLLVLLHGFGNGSRSWVRDPAPKLLEQLGDQAPVVVSPDGGIDSWWLNRSSGDWKTYVVDEVIPDAVERFGVDPERVAISGFSMGGAGAFTIAMHHPGRFCAVGGHDSAIATSFEESATSQFDSPAHFRANDVLAYAARSGAFPNADLSLDRGRDDVFISGQDAFVDALRSGGAKVDYRIEPGLHSMRSVRRHLAPAFDDYADALASCEQLDGAPRSSR